MSRAVRSLAGLALFVALPSCGLTGGGAAGAEVRALAGRFFAAWRDGDAETIRDCLSSDLRDRGAGGFAPREEGWDDFSVRRSRARGDWGLALVRIEQGGKTAGDLPLLAHRVEGRWTVRAVAFAAAEIPLILSACTTDADGDWMERQLFDWTVEGWSEDPEIRDLSPGRPVGPLPVTAETRHRFRIRLDRPATVRIRVEADGDIGPGVAMVRPDGRWLPCLDPTARSARAVLSLPPGTCLAIVGAKGTGQVTVTLAADEPTALVVNRPIGPIRLEPQGTLEFRVDRRADARGEFRVVPAGAGTGESEFRVGMAMGPIHESRQGLSIEFPMAAPAVLGVAYLGPAAVDVFVAVFDRARPGDPAQALRAGAARDLSLSAGEVVFLPLAPEVPAGWSLQAVPEDGGPVVTGRVDGPAGVRGVILGTAENRRVRLTVRAGE